MRLVHVASWSEAESDSYGADHCFFSCSFGHDLLAIRTSSLNICDKIMCIDFDEWNRCLAVYAKLIVRFALLILYDGMYLLSFARLLTLNACSRKGGRFSAYREGSLTCTHNGSPWYRNFSRRKRFAPLLCWVLGG
jgi:hypothetical protein